jgi:hypothetical protein
MNIHQKFIEILTNVVLEQNKQLLTIISENEKISKKELFRKYLASKNMISNTIILEYS